MTNSKPAEELNGLRFLFDLPYPPEEVMGNATFTPARETRLSIPLRRDGVGLRAVLEFGWTRAYKFTTEPLCTLFQLKAYDRVLEVQDSPWLVELIRDKRERGVIHLDLSHFMVYIADSGCFEFAAETWRYFEVADV